MFPLQTIDINKLGIQIKQSYLLEPGFHECWV